MAIPDGGAGDGAPDAEPPLAAPTHLALGAQHSCALLADGTVACWGDNGSGQLGIGSQGGGSSMPVRAAGLANAVSLSSLGGGHTCTFVGGDGYCWGDNSYEQIVAGSGQVDPRPTMVPNLHNAVELVAGARNSCAVFADQTAKCWGDNTSGQVGDGVIGGLVSLPTPVSGLQNVQYLQLGGLMDSIHACVVDQSFTVECWGSDTFGQLGDSGTAIRPSPVPVPSLSNVAELTLGRDHTCALTGDKVACWGSGAYGAVGDGMNSHDTPTLVAGLDHVIQLVGGTFHNCALRADQTVWCWGRNDEGELGDTTKSSRGYPLEISAIAGAEELRCGALHTCVRVGGAVWCWGWNRNGQLGDGTNIDQAAPVRVQGW
jgi:alpha-tubulin suppressor-like RCC1 family protein